MVPQNEIEFYYIPHVLPSIFLNEYYFIRPIIIKQINIEPRYGVEKHCSETSEIKMNRMYLLH